MTVTTFPARPSPAVPVEVLAVRPWPDLVIDALGHDPRSAYVERFWLGILGPSTTWLLRLLAAGLEAEPAGFPLSVADTARAIGVGGASGRHSPFLRALGRCCQFHLAQLDNRGAFAVRRKLPPLNRRQVAHLPTPLLAEHDRWQQAQLAVPVLDQQRTRARRLALSLVELGDDIDGAERELLTWRLPPPLCREAAAWAWDRHRAALAEVASATGPSTR